MQRTIGAPDPAAPPAKAAYYDATNFAAFREAKSAFIVRNADRLREASAPSERNVVILGTGRSGTTMTAGLMIQLGFEFGDRINGRLGDVEMSAIFDRARASTLKWRFLTLRRDFGRLIKARNAHWGRFAFKSPDLAPFFPLLAGTLKSPVYIIPTRNAFDTSFGFSHNAKGMWRKSFFLVNAVQLILSMIAVRTRRPVLVFSYERAVRAPEAFIEMLADFLMVDVDEAKRRELVAYIDPSTGYHPVSRLRGHIDQFDEHGLRGWVSDILNPRGPVEIVVASGAREIYRGPANASRRDVKACGFHDTGDCGIAVDFDPPLDAGEMAAIEVRAPATGHVFWTPGRQTIP